MNNVNAINPHRPVKDMFGITWPAWQYFGDPRPTFRAKPGRGGKKRRNRRARRAPQPLRLFLSTPSYSCRLLGVTK